MSCPLKDSEINRTTSILHLLTLLITGTAMVQTGWFRIRGNQCIPHLGLAPFFGFVESHVQAVQPSLIDRRLHYGEINQVMDSTVTGSYIYPGNVEVDKEVGCISPRLVNMMRVIIFLCFDIIIFCLLGIFLNISNVKSEHVKTIQRSGIMSIMTFVTVIMIIGVSFYVTVIIEEENNFSNKIRDVAVSYEFGFYVIVAAGVISIFNAAISLLFGNVNDMMIIVRRPLIEDWDGTESFNIEPSHNIHRSLSNPNCISFPVPSRMLQRPRILPHPPEAGIVGDDLAMLPPPPPYTP